MFDTDVLIEVCTPGRHKQTKEWFQRLLLVSPPPELLASVVADYELRRGFEAKGAGQSLEHFEELSKSLQFVPLSTDTTRSAASLSTSAQLSDTHVLIAAQALAEGAVLVTADEAFRAFAGLEVRRWHEIDPERLGGDADSDLVS